MGFSTDLDVFGSGHAGFSVQQTNDRERPIASAVGGNIRFRGMRVTKTRPPARSEDSRVPLPGPRAMSCAHNLHAAQRSKVHVRLEGRRREVANKANVIGHVPRHPLPPTPTSALRLIKARVLTNLLPGAPEGPRGGREALPTLCKDRWRAWRAFFRSELMRGFSMDFGVYLGREPRSRGWGEGPGAGINELRSKIGGNSAGRGSFTDRRSPVCKISD
jgi:hypothetical protein